MSSDDGPPSTFTGVVISGVFNVFDVRSSAQEIFHCSIKGKRLDTSKCYNPLAPGDVVEVATDGASYQIVSLLPRRNAVTRYNEKRRAVQMLASNVDNVFIVTTPAHPDFKPHFIDRALVQCEQSNVTPTIVCNKYDLIGEANSVEETLCAWEAVGYQVLRISAKTGGGMSELAALLSGRRSVFIGQSGVGKSSLINVLDDTCVLKVGSLSRKYGKGTHTTTKGVLLYLTLNTSLVGGVRGVTCEVIDTPGVKRYKLHSITSSNLSLYFREISPLLSKCQYGASCTHTSESGCAVIKAVGDGTVSTTRYNSYLKIREELREGEW